MAKPTVRWLSTRYLWERRASREMTFETARNYRYILDGFIEVAGEDRAPRSLHEADVLAWMASRSWGASTTAHALSIVRGFSRWLMQRGYIGRDFALGVRGPRMPTPVPRGLDSPAVARALDRSCPDARGRAMLVLMVQEGLRCCEVSRLELGDVNLAKGLVLVRGKGGRERVLPLSAQSSTEIRLYLREHPGRGGPLFRSYRRPWRGLTPPWISQLVTGWLRDAGVDASAHALRHTAATDMLLAGAHLRDVQAALGHARLATTERYLPWLVHDLEEAMGGRWYGGPPEAA